MASGIRSYQYALPRIGVSSLFVTIRVTKKVQRRTLASGTYPSALLPSAALVLRAPPPVTVAFATPLVPPLPGSRYMYAQIATRPVAGPGGSVQCPVAGRRALGHAGSCAPSPSRHVGGVPCQLAARGRPPFIASWAQLASQI